MKTAIIKSKDKNVLSLAIRELKKGGVIIYPSESSYGIGADATNSKAIGKIFRIKGRENKPISIIVSSVGMAKRYAHIDKEVMLLIKKFMPGRLTIVAKKKKTIPEMLSKNTIGFRIPPHKFSLKLLKKFGSPVTATSANLSGKPPLYRIKEVVKTFSGKVDLIIDAGNLPNQKPSTVFDASNKEVLRKGAVKEEDITACLKA